MTGVTVHQLFIYPLKSARGIALSEAQVDARGFRHDRRWMLVDESGQMLTQRVLPRMALISVALAPAHLAIRAPGLSPLEIPLGDPAGPRRVVRVWGDTCEAVSLGPEAAGWFTTYLELPCHLVYMPDDVIRPVDPAYSAASAKVSFADGFPVLLLSEGSLAELNSKLPQPLSIERFRPNIVVTGCLPFAEDDWGWIRIGPVSFRVVKPCSRCSITTVDPMTGERGPEPLRTLATFRSTGSGVLFGQNVIPVSEGSIRLSDEVVDS